MRACLSILASLSLLGACDPPQSGRAGTLLPPLSITALGPTPILVGSSLIIDGTGFVPEEVATLEVLFRGSVDNTPVDITVAPIRLSDLELEIPVTGQLAERLIPTQSARFVGAVVVRRLPVANADLVETALAVDLAVQRSTPPAITSFSPLVLYPGEPVVVTGSGFLHAGEGNSLVTFEGNFATDTPSETTIINNLVVPAFPTDPRRRDLLSFELTPDIFGIRPGSFEGTVNVSNEFNYGLQLVSAPLGLNGVRLERPYISEVYPLAATRGQRVYFLGRGFLPPDGLLQASTIMLFEGSFTPQRGEVIALNDLDALAVYPDDHRSNLELSAVLRAGQSKAGTLTGLGDKTGRFDGTVTPLLVAGPDLIRGKSLSISFEVQPQRQIVYLKALPSFADALGDFGLAAEAERVKQRVLEVCARDFEGISIEFRWERPIDFVEFAIIEIGRNDPNGQGLFGLDNTAGKDTGNLRLDDVVGGFNAETHARALAAYGGIFPSEFLNFSPTLSTKPFVTARFDDLFAPIVPALGGRPAEPGELDAGGPRAASIAEAIRVFGNLLGNTISHEVGHTVGLAAVDGNFHNIGDNPGWIMDAGLYRPFAERAEIDGQGPAVFAPFNRQYLESVLPLAP